MLVKLSSFSGLVPKTAPDKLPASASTIARNCRLTSGDIEPWRAMGSRYTIRGLVAPVQSLYYYIPESCYLTFLEDTDVVPSPIAQDTNGRIYMTDATNGATMAIKSGISIDALGRTIIARRPLGVSAPDGTPTISGSGGSSDFTVARALVYTFVSDLGEEGPPSTPSATVTVKQDDTISVTGMTTTAPTGETITKKRLYITSVGTAGATFLFWKEVDLADATASGAVDPLLLGESLPSTYWTKPPTGLLGLVPVAGNFMAAFRDNEVWFSEPYYPHAWPVQYMLTFNDNVVGLGVDGSTLLVLTEAHVYIVSVTTPDTATVSTFPDIIPCASKRSICSTPAGVIFASEDGLYAANSAGVASITKDYWTKPQWQDLTPSGMHAAYQNGEYVFFYRGTSGFVFSLNEEAPGKLSEFSFYASAAASLTPDDELAFVYPSGADQVVGCFDEDAYYTLSFLWQSRLVIAPEPVNFSCIRVTIEEIVEVPSVEPDPPDNTGGALASSMVGQYSLGGDWWTSYYANRYAQQKFLKAYIYAGCELKASFDITSDRIHMLPSGFRERKWQVALEGNVRVQSIAMATSTVELMTGPLMPGTSV